MSEPDESQIVSLVNSGDGRYARYFAALGQALGMVSSWAREWSDGALVASSHLDYLRGLDACFGMLQSRFMFETNESLTLDLSHSSYPHGYMLARIASDRAEALSEHFKGERAPSSHFKQVFLDNLFETGTVSSALLNRIACARYAEVVASIDGMFDPRFTCGTAEPHGKEQQYRIQWSAFDATLNVPIICGMVFRYAGKDLQRALTGLKLVLKHESKAGVSIATLAHCIDTGAGDISPLVLTRATLGPLYLPGFTNGPGVWNEVPGVQKGDDILIDIIIDRTHAVSSRKPSRLAVGFGVSPAETQVYAIRTENPLCYARGADEVERILILPYRTLQAMRKEDRNNGASDISLVPYTKQGELQ